MNELALIEELGEALKPSTEQPPAALRHRVDNGIRRGGARRLLPPRTAGWPAGARVAWRVGAPAAAAAAVAAALVAGNLADVAGNAPAPPSAGASGAGTADSRRPATVTAAGQVLTLAAQHAEATSALDARADQFVYVESVEVRSEVRGARPDRARTVGPVRVRTWLSVDGTRDGLVIEEPGGRTRLSGCRDGLRAETIDRPDTTPKVPCTPEPAYRDTVVPADPDALLAYLYDPADRTGHYVWVGTGEPRGDGPFVRLSDDQAAFEKLAGLLYRNHSPAVQAAAFRAAARIPGVRVRTGVADAAGRGGVAVTRTEVGLREELVFDRRTYRFLGHNSVVAEFDLAGATVSELRPDDVESVRIDLRRGMRPGDVLQKWAVVRTAIADRAGQRP